MDRVRKVLAELTVVGWVVTVPASVAVATRPDHPARLLVILLGVTVVGVTMLWVQVSLLGNFLKAYLMGFNDAKAGVPEPGKPARLRSVP